MQQAGNAPQKNIARLIQQGASASYVDLCGLSNLDKIEQAHFQSAWKITGAEQRIRLLTRLEELSENDFSLDFTAIFMIALDDPEPSVRIRAIEGLEVEDKHFHLKPIIQAVSFDESGEVRAAAAAALGKFALMAELDELPAGISEDIFQALIGALENPRETIEVKRRALESVAVFQQEPVAKYIEDYYYSDDAEVKASAIYAMGRNCSSRWLSFLIDEMQSSIPEFKYEAARASGELEDEEAVPCLVDLTQDEDRQVQQAAVDALGKIGGQEARECLQHLAQHADDPLREAASAALAGLLACEDPLSLNF